MPHNPSKTEQLARINELLEENQKTLIHIHVMLTLYMRNVDDEATYDLINEILDKKNSLDNHFFKQRLDIINS